MQSIKIIATMNTVTLSLKQVKSYRPQACLSGQTPCGTGHSAQMGHKSVLWSSVRAGQMQLPGCVQMQGLDYHNPASPPKRNRVTKNLRSMTFLRQLENRCKAFIFFLPPPGKDKDYLYLCHKTLYTITPMVFKQ